jgi:fumarate reductase flavoprotein subunit
MKSMQKTIVGLTALFFAFTLFVFSGCPTTESDPEALVVRMTPGTYTAKAEGFRSPFDVWVTVSETQITNIVWDGLNDSDGLGLAAVPIMRDNILIAQTTAIDSISGATVTSLGFKYAVAEALNKAGAPSSFTSVPKSPGKVEKTVNAGVLVIGSGIAGLSAAVQAKVTNAGATVIVIEKQDIIGGTTKTSAGVVYAALDDTQVEADNLAAYYMMRAQNYADETLVKFFADNSYETLGFLGIDGSNPYAAMATGTAAELRCRFSAGGNGLVQYLYDKAKTTGVTVMTGVKGTALITNEAGVVTGVKAESKTIDYTFNVSGGVVIATGGFDSDHNGLMAAHNPDSKNDIPQSNWGNVGDGIQMGIKIGADTVFKGGKIGWIGISPGLEGSHYYSAVINEDGDLLNLEPPDAGTADGHTLTAVIYDTHKDDYAVVHKRMLDARTAAGGKLEFWAISNTPPDANYVRMGLAYTNATVAGLAADIKANPDKLEASFASGQSISNMFGPPSVLINTGDVFTATRAVPSSIGSMGGLKINTRAEVLKGGQPIPGLYAAGETANGDLFYLEYPASGSSLATGATFGREAGKNAAGRVPPPPGFF